MISQSCLCPCTSSSFAKLTFGLAVLLGPRVVPLKARSSPLCLCFLSGLSFCASWWEPPARALGKTSRLLIGTPGPTLTSAVGGWAQLSGRHSQEQEVPTPCPPSSLVIQGHNALPKRQVSSPAKAGPLFTQQRRQEVAAGYCHTTQAPINH